MYCTAYPYCTAVRKFLNSNLIAVEQTSFETFRKLSHLIRVVEAVEEGARHRAAAANAIRQFNLENRTDWTYDQILGRYTDRLLSNAGEWALYTESPLDFLTGQHDDIDAALEEAPDHVDWAIFLSPENSQILVFRSPYLGYRETLGDFDVCSGLEDGEHRAYTLPCGVEEAIRHELNKAQRRAS